MAALTANKNRKTKLADGMRPVLGEMTGADSSEFYQGAMCCHNNSGKIARAADTANFKIAGVVRERLTTGASNTSRVKFEWGQLEWFAHDGNISNASIGLDAVILDDGTITNAATATNDVRIGRIHELETIDGTAGAWVHVGVFSTAAA
jgi:hypothetical protein